ncbi:MAG: hypothetical protein M1816_000048 [Peltula sp. TS41687]|nr:MAG: hypothetical protein M1816_000048 [Peltula sp. TS41687]
MNPNTATVSTTGASDTWPRNRRKPHASSSDVSRSRNDDCPSGSAFDSPFTSPRPSRTASPIARPWMLQSSGSSTQQSVTTIASGLWGQSWSALQGLASTVLGGEGMERPKGKTNPAIRPPPRRSSSEARTTWLNSHPGPAQWGPEPNVRKATDQIAAGSRQSRDALVRARRRESLLAANDHALADHAGNLKRRVSDDHGVWSSRSPADQEREGDAETLAYLHHVKPYDTVAGVIIQFNCQPAAFRKANRLWPNDPIQSRETVVLPVEACGVKGRPVEVQAQTSEPAVGKLNVETPNDGETSNVSTSRTGAALPSSKSQEHHDDPPWTHVSWVHIDGHSTPVEIVRMPRKTLAYFPPRRRRSVSLELEGSEDSLGPLRFRDDESHKGRTGPGMPSYFARRLHGPGGVGTLGGGTRSPGPRQDKLNKYLAHHLPSVAAPRDSFDSVSSNVSTGLENVGSAIEGWLKKAAAKAATIAETAGGRRSGDGDLIELSDGLEGSDDGHSRTMGGRVGGPTGPEDMERALRERFPMRGRIDDGVRRKRGD